MKKFFALLVAFFATLSMNAQTSEPGTITITPQVGVAGSSYFKDYSYNGQSVDSKMHFGVTGGVEVGYQCSKWFKPTVGVMFQNVGNKFERTANNNTSEINDFSVSYLAFPVMANFYVLNGLALKCGVQPTHIFRANDKVADQSVRINYNTMDFQIPVGISYEFKNIVLDARYNFGTIRLQRSTYQYYPFAENKNIHKNWKNSYFTVTLGYKFNIKFDTEK